LNALQAKIKVEKIEIHVNCPHCEFPAKAPSSGGASLLWPLADIRQAFGRSISCAGCHAEFELPTKLGEFLLI
jgi:hypothetical protein